MRLGLGTLTAPDSKKTAEERLFDLSGVAEDQRGLLLRLHLIDVIDGRIATLRRRATAVLIAIAFALIATVLVVIFAGRLTSLDASAVSNTDRLSSELDKLESKLSALSEVKRLSLSQSDDVKRQIDFIQSRLRGPVLSTDPNFLQNSIELTNAHIAATEKLLLQAWELEIKSERGFNSWQNITATAITRIGVVLIIVFLVQILMGLYRYNTRLLHSMLHGRTSLL